MNLGSTRDIRLSLSSHHCFAPARSAGLSTRYSLLDLSLRMCSRAVNVALLCSSCVQYSCKGALCPVLHVGWAQCDMKTSLFKHI